MWGNNSGRTSGFLGILVLFTALAGARAGAQEAPADWQGWYGGGILGYASTEVDLIMGGSRFSDEYSGVAGGVLGGYNFFVSDRMLAGLEADLTFADLGDGMSLARHKASFLGRLGFFATPSLLLFGVAGIAGGQYEASITATTTTTTLIFDEDFPQGFPVATTVTGQVDKDKRLWGFTIGGGFEREINSFRFPARFGLEYRYTDFTEWDFVALGQAFSIDPDVHEVRARFVVPIN